MDVQMDTKSPNDCSSPPPMLCGEGCLCYCSTKCSLVGSSIQKLVQKQTMLEPCLTQFLEAKLQYSSCVHILVLFIASLPKLETIGIFHNLVRGSEMHNVMHYTDSRCFRRFWRSSELLRTAIQNPQTCIIFSFGETSTMTVGAMYRVASSVSPPHTTLPLVDSNKLTTRLYGVT